MSIISILVALIMPAVNASRSAARRLSCGNNLRQLSLALQNYHSRYSVFPSATGKPNYLYHHEMGMPIMSKHYSFICKVLPDLEQAALYNNVNFDVQLMDYYISSRSSTRGIRPTLRSSRPVWRRRSAPQTRAAGIRAGGAA